MVEKTQERAAGAVIVDEDDSGCTSADDNLRDETLLAAGIGLREDDPTLPCLTARMWVIAIGFCLVGSGVNTLYTFRFPSVSLAQSAVQFLAYPVGKAWERILPDWGLHFRGRRYSLNPGPFSYKENILVYIMANLSFLTRLSADVLTEQRVFYGLKAGWGFELTMTLATLLFGFVLAGLTQAIVVEPSGMLWPGVLGNTALNAALHARRATGQASSTKSFGATRYTFFLLAFSIAFCWYWFPGLLFPALSYFTWVCWIAPKNAVVNQLLGMKSGLGLLPLTFDWTQVAYIGNPLVVPTWVILNVLASLVFWVYIVTPALYYSNFAWTAHLPIQSNSIFDDRGKVYNVSRVVNKKDGFSFNETGYGAYSEMRLPVTYALNAFGLCFASMAAVFSWLVLEKRAEIADVLGKLRLNHVQSLNAETRNKAGYRTVPTWWFLASLAAALALAFAACEAYPVQLRWYGVLLALAVASFFYIPLAWIYGTTNVKVQIDLFCRIIAGYIWEGKVLANIWFFNLAYISTIKGLAFSQDLKLGLYCNIPPRTLFLVQFVGIAIGSVCQVSVLNWALEHIPHICTPQAENNFICAFSRTHFNTSMIWGALGPRRTLSEGSVYRPLCWFFLLGAVLPLVPYILRRYVFKRTNWLNSIHVPLFLGGLNFIPPASGVNYGSWALFGLLFGLLIKRRARTWWKRYNFVLAAALDCSAAIAGVVVFFAVFYTGAAKHLKWWGTDVYKDTCDWKACPYLSTPTGK